jgi:uncharacterized membrane protein YdjX (TVP38/TMEM64 family)
MIKKIGLAIIYSIISGIIYLYGDQILSWLKLATVDLVPITLLIATMMALFPIIPYPVVGAVIGAAYGPLLGGFVTWAGSCLASIFMFLFVRYGYQDWGLQTLYRYQLSSKITLLFEKNAFLTILFTRVIPFIPSIIVNVYSAISKVTFTTFTVASIVGKIPAMLLFALLGSQWMTRPVYIIYSLLFYATFLTIAYSIYRLWTRKNLRN